MLLFAVAQVLKLQDGTYAINIPELPECEARGRQFQLVREEFSEALRDRALGMVETGDLPPLYPFEELELRFRMYTQTQISPPNRLPGTLDTAIIVRIKVPDDIAERIMAMRGAPREALRPDAPVRHEDVPANTDDYARQTAAGTREVTNNKSPDGTPSVIAEIEELLGTPDTEGGNDPSGSGEAQADPSVRLEVLAGRLSARNRRVR